jgi:hypothetical protein
MIKLDKIREDKLIELAKTRFDPDLKLAELKVLRDSTSSEDLPLPDEKAPRPEVRADFLRWLATDPEAAPYIDPKGLRVYAATIPGKLDLRNCRIPVTLDFQRCSMKGEINLLSAETRGIYFLDSYFDGDITADEIDIHGPLILRRNSFSGTIRLLGAKIESDLDSTGAKLKATGNALILDGSKIGGFVFLINGFESEGTIRMLGAKIERQLDCSGAKLKATGNALILDNVKIGGNVFLKNGFESEGTIRMQGAEIEGNLEIILAKVVMVVCKNTFIKGDLIWLSIGKSENTYLSLAGAKVKKLHDDKGSWPDKGNLNLDGLVYEGLKLRERLSDEDIKNGQLSRELPLKARDRIEWIELQPEKDTATAQPWVQLANLLNNNGDPEGAREVRYAYQRRLHGRNVLLRGRTYIFDQLEQWPLRISVPIAILGAIGSLIFWRAHRMSMMAPTEREAFEEFHKSGKPPERYVPFCPIIYALENVLPVVKLGQDSAWQPNPQAVPRNWQPNRPKWLKSIAEWSITRWIFRLNYSRLAALRWLLILLGWALAIILATALAEHFKK